MEPLKQRQGGNQEEGRKEGKGGLSPGLVGLFGFGNDKKKQGKVICFARFSRLLLASFLSAPCRLQEETAKIGNARLLIGATAKTRTCQKLN